MLIIAGALYIKGNTVLRAHYTGDFVAVDCGEYETKETIFNQFSKAEAIERTDEDANFIEVNHVKYFECYYGPHNTKGMELLSDLGSLSFFDENDTF
jgi:hypothetical protein